MSKVSAEFREQVLEQIETMSFVDVNNNTYLLKNIQSLNDITALEESFKCSITMNNIQTILNLDYDNINKIIGVSILKENVNLTITPDALLMLLEHEFSLGMIIGAGNISNHLLESLETDKEENQQSKKVPSNELNWTNIKFVY